MRTKKALNGRMAEVRVTDDNQAIINRRNSMYQSPKAARVVGSTSSAAATITAHPQHRRHESSPYLL
jgi:hypothetical protein